MDQCFTVTAIELKKKTQMSDFDYFRVFQMWVIGCNALTLLDVTPCDGEKGCSHMILHHVAISLVETLNPTLNQLLFERHSSRVCSCNHTKMSPKKKRKK